MIEKIKDTIKYIIKSFALKIIIIKNSIIYSFRKDKDNDNKEKNILIIISRLHTGGAEKAAINIAEELYKKFPVKILIYTKREKEEYECIPDEYKFLYKHVTDGIEEPMIRDKSNSGQFQVFKHLYYDNWWRE